MHGWPLTDRLTDHRQTTDRLAFRFAPTDQQTGDRLATDYRQTTDRPTDRPKGLNRTWLALFIDTNQFKYAKNQAVALGCGAAAHPPSTNHKVTQQPELASRGLHLQPFVEVLYEQYLIYTSYYSTIVPR